MDNEDDWKFPEIDHNKNHKCPNVRFYKGRNLCIIFKKPCSGWILSCMIRGMTVNKKLYDVWKQRGYIK